MCDDYLKPEESPCFIKAFPFYVYNGLFIPVLQLYLDLLVLEEM